jgi:hypothetical protein
MRAAARNRTRRDGCVFCKIGNLTAENAESAEKQFEEAGLRAEGLRSSPCGHRPAHALKESSSWRPLR